MSSPPPNNAARRRAALLFDQMLKTVKPHSEEKLITLLGAIEEGDSATAMAIIEEDRRLIHKIPKASDVSPLNPYDHYSRSAFCEACSQNNPELVKFMIDHGADVNKQGANGELYTPLHAAIYSEPFGVHSNMTPEEYASAEDEQRHTEIVRLLFAHGAVVPSDPDLVRYACKNMHLNSLRMLLEHGANPNDGLIAGSTGAISGLDFLLSTGASEGDSVYIAMLDLLCSTPGANAAMCKQRREGSLEALTLSVKNGGARRRRSRRKTKKQRKTRRR